MSHRARRLPASTPFEPYQWGGSGTTTRRSGHSGSSGPVLVVPQGTGVSVEQVAQAERDGYARGYAEAERASQGAIEERSRALMQRLGESLQELASLRSRQIRDTEKQMVQLALAMAKRVVHREVLADRDLLVTMARVALERLGDASKVTVRLNPDDHKAIRANAFAPLGSHVSVVEDGRVPRGGCRVESEMGLVDAGLDAQLNEIAQALFGRSENQVRGDTVA